MSQNRYELIRLVAEKTRLPARRVGSLVKHVFDCMADALQRGERVEIRGFGTLTIREYRARQGRNPRSGAAIPVKAKRRPYFKVSAELRARVNSVARALATRDAIR